MLGKRDILGAAETGSGKTLAFGLPILCGILKHKLEHNLYEEQVDEDESESDFEEREEDIEELNTNGMFCYC